MRLFLFSLCLSCAPTLAGRVLAPGGVATDFEHARINVSSLDQSETRTFVIPVDNTGKFVLKEKLSKGSYLVEALVPGFKIASKELMLDDAQEVELNLVPIPPIKSRAIGINTNLDESRGGGGATLMPPSL